MLTTRIASLLLFVLFCAQPSPVWAWKVFKLGRFSGKYLRDEAHAGAKSDAKELWFEQKLDHFNPVDLRNFSQRYFALDKYYNRNINGPVFLMIGGEGEAKIKTMYNDTWIDYAEKFGAMCFMLEHRYYGKTHPTADLSTKNLQYLNSRQALADLASFITAMNEQYRFSEHTKWIAFGGSYPGSLAAWLRMKYPHLVAGAMSASGPLLAQLDFQDYLKVVYQSLGGENGDCVKTIAAAVRSLNETLKKVDSEDLFHLCNPKNDITKNDIFNLYESLAGNFEGVVQYNKDNRDSKGSNVTIDILCGIMTNKSIGAPVKRLAAVNDVILEAYDQKCLDYKYDKMIHDLRNISWLAEQAEGGRQWMYQTCTEFGFYQSSSAQPQIFGDFFPVEFFVQQCVDVFGPKFNRDFIEQRIAETNTYYGALDLEVSNVVFVHGSIDPWHALGITQTKDNRAPAIYIEGTAHCANMYPASVHDSGELREARLEVEQHIDSWLSH